MPDWGDAYRRGTFSINTREPSEVVKKGLSRLHIDEEPKAVDLGCGNGRNSIYASESGFMVDAVDKVYLGFLEGLPQGIKNRINFHQNLVKDFQMHSSTHLAVIVTRLIQYLPLHEVKDLFGRSAEGLTTNGVLMITYTASGGIFSRPEVDVEKFQHPAQVVREELQRTGLDIVFFQQGTNKSVYTPYQATAEIYDILAQKR